MRKDAISFGPQHGLLWLALGSVWRSHLYRDTGQVSRGESRPWDPEPRAPSRRTLGVRLGNPLCTGSGHLCAVLCVLNPSTEPEMRQAGKAD